MPVVETVKAQLTNRYWKASLAWYHIGDWAKGWTQGSFIEELCELCLDQGNLGRRADHLLDTMIYDKQPEKGKEAFVVSLQAYRETHRAKLTKQTKYPQAPMTQDVGQQAISQSN